MGNEEIKSELESLEKENLELRIINMLNEALRPVLEKLTNVETTVSGIDVKVKIHNNYEGRISGLEKDQNKFKGGFYVAWGLVTLAAAIIVKLI